jgi:OmpA-OmpF porin, OOP family
MNRRITAIFLAAIAIAPAALAQQRIPYTLPFDAGSTKVNAKAAEAINKALPQIKTCADNGVRVTGHTDRSTSDEQSSVIATERARAVKDYLITKGILDSRISWVGRSENEPAVETADGVKEPRNNRVEIRLVCD